MSQLPFTRTTYATVPPSGESVGDFSSPASSLTRVKWLHGASGATDAPLVSHAVAAAIAEPATRRPAGEPPPSARLPRAAAASAPRSPSAPAARSPRGGPPRRRDAGSARGKRKRRGGCGRPPALKRRPRGQQPTHSQ